MSTTPLFSTTHVRCFILFLGARRCLRDSRRPHEKGQKRAPCFQPSTSVKSTCHRGGSTPSMRALTADVVILAYGLWKLPKGVNGGATQCNGQSSSSFNLGVTVDKLVLSDGWRGCVCSSMHPSPELQHHVQCGMWAGEVDGESFKIHNATNQANQDPASITAPEERDGLKRETEPRRPAALL